MCFIFFIWLPKQGVLQKAVLNALPQRHCEIVRKRYAFSLFSLPALSSNHWSLNTYFSPHRTASPTISPCTKLALMQKNSILFSIDQQRLCFLPLTTASSKDRVRWPGMSCDPHPGQHLWASSESTMPDKWVCSDRQLMEWLAKVMMLGEAPFWSLISIWTKTTFCKCLITSAKGQPGRTEIHHLMQTLPFLLARVQK